MDDLLKRLLDAELQGEAIVDEASRERERMVQQALGEARAAEASFEAGLGELRRHYLKQSEERAAQAVAELARQYAEHQRELRRLDQRIVDQCHTASTISSSTTELNTRLR